ncbi:MAG TPA: alpha/beta fold hydrolase [Jatrophihabitantaceae bacterium]|jgi:pimeloyl-ACP methyl ester carboxylesterase|nr:alpha/beta fold hydrolase [Jatrophihabitantaceae bacterium]
MTSTRRARSSDGTEIAIFTSGAQRGPIVVAVHGYPDNHTVWDNLALELGERCQVVRYDVRGAGESDKPVGRAAYRLTLLVDDLRAVLDAVAPQRPVHLLGHDWGSVQLWAAVADERLTGRIASFTSISGPSLDQAGPWLRGARRYPRAALRQLAHSYYTLLFQLPKLPEAAVRKGLFERAVGPRNRDDQLNGLNLYRANMLRKLRSPRPAQVGIPVQVLAPDRDPYVTADIAFGAPEPYVPNLRTRLLDGGHWVIRDQPDVVAGCVQEFIDEVAGAPESRAASS